MALQRLDTVIKDLDITTSSGVAYASGDQVGSLLEIQNAVSDSSCACIVTSINLLDIDKQKSPMDIFFFSEDTTVASVDNGPVNISDSEMKLKFLGLVKIIASDYSDLLASSVACKINIELVLQGTKVFSNSRKKSLYALLVARGNPTYASTASLVLKLGLRKS